MDYRTPTEYQECVKYCEWALYQPVLRDYLIKIVNEGKRSVIMGKSLKRILLRPGLPDYYFPVPNKKYIGLWIEMKRANMKKHHKQEEQDDWIKKLNEIGHYATYAYGADDAIEITKKYMDNKI